MGIPWSGIRHWNPYFVAHNDVGICQRLPLLRLYTLDSVTQTSLSFLSPDSSQSGGGGGGGVFFP